MKRYPRGYRPPRKVFHNGDAVEFQRNTDFSCPWESGIYSSADVAWRGWHHVQAKDGTTQFVPTRRLRRCADPTR